MDKFKETFKNGYTLAEVLIVLGIIGIVCAFMIPSVMTGIPSKYESLQKKAAYMLESTMSDIVNNEVYYERMDTIGKDENNHNIVTYTHGLANTYPVTVDGVVYGSYDRNSTKAKQKFCQIFASKFNLKEGTKVNCKGDADFVISQNTTNNNSLKPTNNKTEKSKEIAVLTKKATPTFTSVEGIQWILPIGKFDKNTLILYKTSADYKSGPNCAYVSKDYYNKYIKDANPPKQASQYIKTTRKECDRPDIFVYVLTPGGKLIKEEATSDEVPERNTFKATNQGSVKPLLDTPIDIEPLTPVKPDPLSPLIPVKP